jgi:hypothetical protein
VGGGLYGNECVLGVMSLRGKTPIGRTVGFLDAVLRGARPVLSLLQTFQITGLCAIHAARPALRRKLRRAVISPRELVAEHRQAAPRLLARGLVLDHVPALREPPSFRRRMSATIHAAGRPLPLNRPCRMT